LVAQIPNFRSTFADAERAGYRIFRKCNIKKVFRHAPATVGVQGVMASSNEA